MVECKQCGFKWISRVPCPKQCIKCKSRYWKEGFKHEKMNDPNWKPKECWYKHILCNVEFKIKPNSENKCPICGRCIVESNDSFLVKWVGEGEDKDKINWIWTFNGKEQIEEKS